MKKLFFIILVALPSFLMAQFRADNGIRNERYRKTTKVGQLNQFQIEAMEHIAKGILNGNLTANEAKQLLNMAEKIELKENRFLRNRNMSNREYRQLENDLNTLDRHIERLRKNADRFPLDRRRF